LRLKTLKKLRTANLNLEFTGSYKKGVRPNQHRSTVGSKRVGREVRERIDSLANFWKKRVTKLFPACKLFSQFCLILSNSPQIKLFPTTVAIIIIKV